MITGLSMIQTVKGTLTEHFETGTEGLMWALQEDNNEGYPGLFIIEDGDELTIYSETNEILFKGVITPDYDAGKSKRPNTSVEQPRALGYWIHWTQKGFTPDTWAAFFVETKNAAVLARKDNCT